MRRRYYHGCRYGGGRRCHQHRHRRHGHQDCHGAMLTVFVKRVVEIQFGFSSINFLWAEKFEHSYISSCNFIRIVLFENDVFICEDEDLS